MRYDERPVGDDSAPTEAWLFAQVILGKPLPRIVRPEARAQAKREELERLAQFSTEHAEKLRALESAEAEARRERENLEWAASISPRAEGILRALERKEAEEREAWSRAEAFVEKSLGETWDPSKHPRLGGSPNAGWWATTGGSGNDTPKATASAKSALDSMASFVSKHVPSEPATFTGSATGADGSRDWSTAKPIAATTAQFTGTHAPVHLAAAARAPAGHHWVPQAVYGALKDRMEREAFEIFEAGTESTGMYNHAFDTWKGVTHDQYSKAMNGLLDDWIQKQGGKLNEKDAKKFLSWIATGHCDDAAFLKKHKGLFDTVFKWRAGFNQSVVIAARAAELNPKLTAAELKAIAQQFVNGKPTKALSVAAAEAFQGIIEGGKNALKKTAKKVLPGLMFISAAMAAKRGWAGDSRYGDGAWGATSEVMRDLVSADLVEDIVFPKVIDMMGGMVDLLVPGLNGPMKKRYIRRGGHLIDMQTGQVVD
jgi:hypothetical protein